MSPSPTGRRLPKSQGRFRVAVWLPAVLLALLVAASIESSRGQPRDVGQQVCSGSQLGSFLCKAGQAVLGGAQRFARLLRRPQHWGVPDDERLELGQDGVGGDQLAGARRPQLPLSGPARRRQRVTCRSSRGQLGVCRPITACYHRHGTSISYELDGSQCAAGNAQVCCPKRDRRTWEGEGQRFNALQLAGRPEEGVSVLGPGLERLRSVIKQVFETSGADWERSREIERSALSEGIALERNSPGDLHQRFIQLRNSKLVGKLARDGADFVAVASRLVRDRAAAGNGAAGNGATECPTNRTRELDGTLLTLDGPGECGGGQSGAQRRSQQLPEIDFSQTELANRCPGEPVCPADASRRPFRSYDGSCNNLRRPGWGRSNSAYTRILAPDYEDGVSELRATGALGGRLPNPRSVSLATVRWSESRRDPRTSLMLMQWGQFVDHDLSLAATTPMLTPNGASIDCCNRRLLQDPRFRHPACISVLLPDNDPFYARFNVGCMNLVRNAPAPPAGCRLRAREQLNQLTHFLDGSQVYGNDEQQARGLRQFRAGLLKASRINGAEFLPFDGRLGEGCILPTEGVRRGMRCFVAGDNRVNELTGLATTHALFLREHNRLARLLASLNPQWDDERLYQEARRVVVAQIQHITYNEWLPLVLGPLVMRDFRLELSSTNGGYSLDYDPATDPSIVNEFAGAAFRLHSLVSGAFNFQTEDGQLIQQFKLRHIFNNPASLYREGNYDGCIHSMINEAAQQLDNQFTEEITNHLFQDTNSSFGMDIVTINIQRGRDHGIPGYNYFRQACGLTKMQSFRQLDQVMVEGAGQVFSQLYQHVDDIDLFIAGNYEKKLKDAVVGPVFGCIIGEQFRRLKLGDRYWYENGNQAGAFTPSQLAELKHSSLARIVCDNSDAIERTQPLAFVRPSEWNPKISCDQIPWIDLRNWQDGQQEQFDPFTFRGSREPTSRKLDTETEEEEDF